jgi:hypothetical protein
MRQPHWSAGQHPTGLRDVCAGGVVRVAVLVAAYWPAGAGVPAAYPGRHVQMLHRRASTGTVGALCASPEGFPVAFLRAATQGMVIKVRQSQARCTLAARPLGRDALAVMHETPMNGQLDTNAPRPALPPASPRTGAPLALTISLRD